MIISTFECKSFVQNSDITHKIIQSMFHCNRAYHNVLYMVIGKNLIIQSDIEPYEIPDSLRLMNSKTVMVWQLTLMPVMLLKSSLCMSQQKNRPELESGHQIS